MNVRSICMSPSELRDRAKTYGQSGRDIEDILSRLSQLQEQLRSEWKVKLLCVLMINLNN